MTVVIAAISLALSVLIAGFIVEVNKTSSFAQRAQTAADAAALAAVVESGPYGQGDPAAMARSYAVANDAKLVECDCPVGGRAAQVTVELLGVTGRARAVLDPDAFAPAVLAFDASSLDPRLAKAVDELVAATKGRVRVISGFRSRGEQLALWREAIARYGRAEVADDWVARPGTSMHEAGLAVDLGGELELAVRMVDELTLPLHRPLAHEPWHFELDLP